MCAQRLVEFITSVETSSLPSVSSPSATGDTVTLGYADANYTPRADVYGEVADITALKAIASGSRFDKQIAFVSGLDLFYKFNSASTATPDDDNVVQPTSGTGRWLKVDFGSSSSGGSASGLESLMQKLENEKYGIITEPLDFSTGISGGYQTNDQSSVGNLMADAATGDTTLYVSWNPIFLNTSDKNFQTTIGWTVFDAGATLTTSTTRKIGTHSLQFDKDGTNVRAGITYDYGSAAFNFASNKYMQFWINLPSISGLSNVFVLIAPSAGNYDRWSVTTNSAGGALATGWNHIKIDLSSAPTSTTGTGYTFGELVRYVSIGVDSTSGGAGQTYTAILIDAVNWSYSDANKFIAPTANEFSIYDTSNQVQKVFSASNTVSEGGLGLSAAIGTAFTGGFSNSDRAIIERSTMSITGTDQIEFQSGFSGNVSTTQYVRSGTIFRESKSLSLASCVDSYVTDGYEVSATAATSVGVTTNADVTGAFVSGDLIDVFRPYYINGETFYSVILSTTQNGTDTYSNPTLTIPLTSTSGVAVGDIVCRRPVTEMAISCVAATAVENFQTLSLNAAPNGVQLINSGLAYPKQESIVAHWSVGGFSNAEGVRNRKGNLGSLTVTGSPSLQNNFTAGRFSGSNWSGSNYLSLSSGIGATDGAGETVEISFWFYPAAGFTGSNRTLWSLNDGVGDRIALGMSAASNTIFINENGSPTGAGSFTLNAWNHCFVYSDNGANQIVYLNGVQTYNKGSAPSTPASTTFYVGINYSGSTPAGSTTLIADVVMWSSGSPMSENLIKSIYNNGVFKPFGGQTLRLCADLNGQTGQKLSMRVKTNRASTTFSPNLSKFGVIKK